MKTSRRQSNTTHTDSVKSKAARFNSVILKRLQKAVEDDPEVDLISKFPSEYSGRLLEMRSASLDIPKESVVLSSNVSSLPDDIRVFLQPSDPISILFPLSDLVKILLADDHEPASSPAFSNLALSEHLFRVMQLSDILWKSPFPHNKMIFKCGPDMVVKVVRKMEDYTEYTTLQYLEKHKPSVPAPRPLGAVRMGRISLMFMTYLGETTLDVVWTSLNAGQKASVQNQLEDVLTNLRSLHRPDEMPFGGVGGEGCKDIGRHVRRNAKPIMNMSDFEEFAYLSPRPECEMFTRLLHQLSPSFQPSVSELPKCVLTHGDLRPDNIAVRTTKSGQCLITGLLDWEYGGFYPEYYECIKSTNCLGSTGDNDWYSFLPRCASPRQYTLWWLLDRVRGSLWE